jgi:hypothetical protein
MPGRFTFPVVFISSVVAILAAIVGIIVLWVPIENFPAQYSYTRIPTLLYAYNRNTSTATCEGTYRSDYYYGWSCVGRVASQTTMASSTPSVRFSMVSYLGQDTYTVRTIYGETYTLPASSNTPQATVTVTVGGVVSAATAAASATLNRPTTTVLSASGGSVGSAFASATLSASTHTVSGSVRQPSYASTLPALLQGNVVSIATSAPTSTVFMVHLPRPKVSQKYWWVCFTSTGLIHFLLLLSFSSMALASS